MATVREFRIEVTDDDLADLRRRLRTARWPGLPADAGWALGTDPQALRTIVDHWVQDFDWRRHEQQLNRHDQVMVDVEGTTVHAVVQRAPGRGLPLVLLHGWPSTVSEFVHLIGPLSDPARHGGDAADAFDVIAVSLPGFGWSGPTPAAGWGADRDAEAVAALLRELGIDRYGVFGTDAGAYVAASLAARHPESVVGLHLQLGGVVLARQARARGEAGAVDEVERRALERVAAYEATGAAYAFLNASKPYSLAYALADSPLGQAAWILEKFQAWSDPGDDPNRPLGLVDVDDALAIVTTYWLTGTAGSAAAFYAAGAAAVADPASTVVKVPTGCAVFPADIVMPSRRWAAERYPNLVHWTEMPRGGHFGALEVPDLLVEDLRAFFRPLR